jgi:hemerythrin
MYSAMIDGKGKYVLGKTLTNLIDYTKGHFAAEERLMQTHNYPDYPRHKAAHDALTARVVGFQKDFEANHAVLTAGVLQFLNNWLSHHIGETDRKIAAYLKSRAA